MFDDDTNVERYTKKYKKLRQVVQGQHANNERFRNATAVMEQLVDIP